MVLYLNENFIQFSEKINFETNISEKMPELRIRHILTSFGYIECLSHLEIQTIAAILENVTDFI